MSARAIAHGLHAAQAELAGAERAVAAVGRRIREVRALIPAQPMLAVQLAARELVRMAELRARADRIAGELSRIGSEIAAALAAYPPRIAAGWWRARARMRTRRRRRRTRAPTKEDPESSRRRAPWRRPP